MGQEQSQPLVTQSYKQQQPLPYQYDNEYQEQHQPPQQIYLQPQDEQVKRVKPNSIPNQNMFQGSFSVSQSKPLNDDGVAQDYDPLQDGKPIIREQQSTLVQQAQPLQVFNPPIQTQIQYQTQPNIKSYQIQEQAAPSSNTFNNYTASFGQLEQMQFHQSKSLNQQQPQTNILSHSQSPAQFLENNLVSPSSSNFPNSRYKPEISEESLQNKYWDSTTGQQYEPRKAEIIERLLNSRTMSGYEPPRKQSPFQVQAMVQRLLEKGKEIETRNGITNNYYDQREMQQCTFQPNLHASTVKSVSPHRSLQVFLDEQNKFLSNKNHNLKRMKANLSEQEKGFHTHRPQILQNSNAIIIPSYTKYAGESAFKRLYDTQKRKKEMKEQNEKELKREEQDNKKSKKSNPQTIERLYNLGKMKVQQKREGNMKQQNKNTDKDDLKQDQDKSQLKSSQMHGKESSKQSEYCLATKIIKEYEQIVSVAVEDIKQQNYLLDYIQQFITILTIFIIAFVLFRISEVLRLMGLISFTEIVESHNFVKERTLVNDAWIVLHGQENSGVSYRNVLLFLFAVMGIDINLPKLKPGQDNNIQFEYSKDQAFPLLRDIEELNSRQAFAQVDQNLQMRLSNEIISRSYVNSQSYASNDDQLNKKYFSQKNKIDYNDMNTNFQEWINYKGKGLDIGTFDENNNWILTQSEVKQIQIEFQLFYFNKLHTEKEKQNYLNINNNNSSVVPLNKQVLQEVNSNQTEQLANNYRSRVWEQTILSSDKLQQLGDKIQHADILIAQREEKQRFMEQIKTTNEESQLFDCTFHPKTTQYVRQQQQQQQLQQQVPLMQHLNGKNQFSNMSTNLGQFHSSLPFERPNNNPMPPVSIGNKRYLELYNLAKPRSQLRDKKTLEVEYEKNCDECTFNPDLAATSNIHPTKLRNSKDVQIKNKEVAIERMRKAWDSQLMFSRKMERGYSDCKNENSSQKSISNQTSPLTDRRRVNSQRQQETHSRNSSIHQKRSPQVGMNNKFYSNGNQGIPQLNQVASGQDQLLNYQHHQDQNYENNQNQEILNQPKQENEEGIVFNNWMGDQHLNNQPISQKRQNPLLYVDINLSADSQERIIVYQGDKPEDLAQKFIEQHGLEEGLLDKLTHMLKEQIESSQTLQQQM